MNEYQSKSDNTIKIIQQIDTQEDYYFLMEYCDLNLTQYHNKDKDKNNIIKIKDIFNKLNKILTVINSNKSFNGDINPDHILIKKTTNENNLLLIYI